MHNAHSRLDEVRSFHAKLMAASSRSGDPRLERVFELVPREAFMPSGPWRIYLNNRYVETPSADPVFLYQNVLVALDAEKGINNGEPFLHASWIGVVAPARGDVVCHIGAGTGYYTAILSLLVLPGGRVEAFEIEEHLARSARENLAPFENVNVRAGDATKLLLPDCDLIYVNAGVVAPPLDWLRALRNGGRMIFPWRPTEKIGIAVLLTRGGGGFAVKTLTPAWFISCIGASDWTGCTKIPDHQEAWSARSAWLTAERPPDHTAVAVYEHVWFSAAPTVMHDPHL